MLPKNTAGHAPDIPSRIAYPLACLLLSIVLVGLYTSIAFTVSGVPFLGAPAVAAAWVALLLDWKRVHPEAWSGTALLLAAGGATILGSPDRSGFWDEHLRSLALLGSSIGTMLGAWLLVTRLSAKTASILFFALAGAVLILCVAEMYTPLRGFSDRARDILYSDRFIYASDLRDMELHGSFRPRVFTQEPSHVAKFVLGMILAWLAVSCLRFRLPIAFGFGAVAAWALRSPTLFALLPGVVILSATRLEMDWVRLRSGRLLVETAVVLVVVLGIIFAGDILKLTGSERLARIANEEDASANIRFFGPLALTGAVWGDYPAFGAGIGGKELVHDHLIDVFSGLQGMRMERFQFGTSVGWGSAFFEFFIYHGIIGSIVGLAGLALLSRAAGHGRLLTTLLLLTLLMFNDSGFTSFRVWTYFGIITGALTLNAQNQRRFGIPKVRRPVPATTIDAAPPPPGDPKRHVAA